LLGGVSTGTPNKSVRVAGPGRQVREEREYDIDEHGEDGEAPRREIVEPQDGSPKIGPAG
jgi:hypothetical protein